MKTTPLVPSLEEQHGGGEGGGGMNKLQTWAPKLTSYFICFFIKSPLWELLQSSSLPNI